MPQTRLHILLSEAEGKQAVCFDTGLEPRAFARTKMSQNLVEKGYIVHPDGSNEAWISSGVCEFENQMRVWGKPFEGERLDAIINNYFTDDKQRQNAIQAVICWIKAKMFLGDVYTTLNAAAAFISQDGSVFFAPPNLANRCLIMEGLDIDYYNCPDLTGMDAAAFCAASILYKLFSNFLPFANKPTLYQDMREGVFLPPHLAAPGLKKELCDLIQCALLLPEKKNNRMEKKTPQEILNGMLVCLSDSSFFLQLSSDEKQIQEKERKSYLFKQNVLVKTKRFTLRNKYPLIIAAVGVLFILFVVFSTIDGAKRRPTTAYMLSDAVINTYYNSFTTLDHVFMEACTQGSNPTIKNDINIAASYFAIYKSRQSYENTGTMPYITAKEWLESGGTLPAPDVFGITDLTFEHISGSEESEMIIYRANYNLWAPNEHARRRTDTLTLRRDKKKNWRITEITRTEI